MEITIVFKFKFKCIHVIHENPWIDSLIIDETLILPLNKELHVTVFPTTHTLAASRVCHACTDFLLFVLFFLQGLDICLPDCSPSHLPSALKLQDGIFSSLEMSSPCLLCLVPILCVGMPPVCSHNLVTSMSTLTPLILISCSFLPDHSLRHRHRNQNCIFYLFLPLNPPPLPVSSLVTRKCSNAKLYPGCWNTCPGMPRIFSGGK